MDTKVITVRDITEDNPTRCLSPLRYLDRCHQCDVFKSVLKRTNGDILKTIEILGCNPHIPDRAIFLIGQRETIKKATEEGIKKIDKELGGKSIKMSEYDKQAEKFLKEHNLNFGATYKECGRYFEEDTDERDIYRIRIRRKDGGNSITFNFGQSIADTETATKPKAYSVLASISSDMSCPYDFEEFCGDYGYDEDSRTAEKIFKKSSKFAERLNTFFREGEKEDLAEIR